MLLCIWVGGANADHSGGDKQSHARFQQFQDSLGFALRGSVGH